LYAIILLRWAGLQEQLLANTANLLILVILSKIMVAPFEIFVILNRSAGNESGRALDSTSAGKCLIYNKKQIRIK